MTHPYDEPGVKIEGWKIPFKTYFLNNGPIKVVKNSKYKSHKPKDKPMWMKTEDGERLINMTVQSVVYTFKTNDEDKKERWCVGLSSGFSANILKSFKYKEDADKYLEELQEKLNDED